MIVIKEAWHQWFKSFLKKSCESSTDALLANKSAAEPNYQLANELHN